MLCLFLFNAKSWASGEGPKDTLKTEMSQPVLRYVGARVFKGNVALNSIEVSDILKSNTKIQKKYNDGRSLRNTGIFLIVAGSVGAVAGMAQMIDGIEYTDYGYGGETYEYTDQYYQGFLIACIGGVAIEGGIACSIIGKIKIRKAIQVYNSSVISTSYNQPGELNYQLGLLNNGHFGFRLTF